MNLVDTGCRLDISVAQQETILMNVCSWMFTHMHPQNIVWEVSAYLGMPNTDPQPPVTATNWCFVSGISAQLFYGTAFTNLTSFVYPNIPQTLYCITCCLADPPIGITGNISAPFAAGQATFGAGAGAGGAPYSQMSFTGQAAQIDTSELEQLQQINKNRQDTTDWYLAEIMRIIAMASVIAAAFAAWIAIFAEQLAIEKIARILKTIWKIVCAMYEAWKAICIAMQMAAAAAIIATAVTEPNSSPPTSHTHSEIVSQAADATQAVKTMHNELTDMIKESAGDIVGAIGVILTSTGIIDFDLKHIAFALDAAAAEFSEIISAVEAMNKDILDCNFNVDLHLENLSLDYGLKFKQMQQFIDQKNEFASQVGGTPTFQVLQVAQNITQNSPVSTCPGPGFA